MKILVTGFDPFAGAQQNPAWEAVSRLPQQLGRATIVSLQVPTIFNRSAAIVHAAIQRERPDVVVSVGQAGGRSALSLERVAINLDDARIADNAGQAPHDQPIQLAGRPPTSPSCRSKPCERQSGKLASRRNCRPRRGPSCATT